MVSVVKMQRYGQMMFYAGLMMLFLAIGGLAGVLAGLGVFLMLLGMILQTGNKQMRYFMIAILVFVMFILIVKKIEFSLEIG
ncbi:MAG: hypothetical protein HWN68_16540 [Desulfobacterales bacterium]|nr:hypothetical protein [Desulfobacterales bacterium]